MTLALLIALVIVLGMLALFQLTLIVGAPLGRAAWGGQHRVLPRTLRIASAVSLLLYAAIAFVALDRAGVLEMLPDTVAQVAMWVIVGYFCLGVVLNLISRSPVERIVMTPAAALLAILSLGLALAP